MSDAAREETARRMDAAIEHVLQAMVQVAIIADDDAVPRGWADVVLNHLDREARNLRKHSRAIQGLPVVSMLEHDRVFVARRIEIRDADQDGAEWEANQPITEEGDHRRYDAGRRRAALEAARQEGNQ